MEKIIREGVWYLVTGIIFALLGWGLANVVSVDADGVRITGIRERVEVWRLTREIRRLEREVERLKRRPLRDESNTPPGIASSDRRSATGVSYIPGDPITAAHP